MGVSDDSLLFVKTRVQLAESLAGMGRWRDALAEFEGVEKDLAGSPDTFRQLVAGNVSWGLALLKVGRADDAHAVIAEAVRHTSALYGESHYSSAETRGFLAMTDAARGMGKRALEGFTGAMPVLLAEVSEGGGETKDVAARTGRLRLILESYLALLTDVRATALEREAGLDAAAEAFRLADVARSASVRQALAASAARATVRGSGLAQLIRREQDAGKQIESLYGLLNNALNLGEDQRSPDSLGELRTRIDRLRQARRTLRQEIENRFPEYAALVNPKPATVEQARAALRPGEALIATYVGEDRTYVWAIPEQGSVAFAAADIGREDLADTVALLRSALEPNAQTLGDIPDFDVAAAYDLYELLLKPVEAGWKRAKSLLVVAHGALGYLPPSLLPTAPVELVSESGALFSNHRDVPWLARSHAVTMLPSVASLATLRGLPSGAPDRKAFAGFGDPLFSAEQAAHPVKVVALTSRGLRTRGLPVRLRAAPKTAAMDSAGLAQLPRLPDTADEVRSIAVALKADLTKDVFLGERADEAAVKAMDLSVYKVIAFATHGLVPGDLDGLTQPALALSSPMVTGGKEDGLLTMGEILGLKLDADWVVLSACNTGSGQGAGAEAVSGLGRAFFYAGTRALLVSNWPVETTSSKALTTDLFRRQAADAGLSRAQALRQAMLVMIDGGGYVDPESGKMVFAYAHPLFWAPFSLIGDGGGGRPAS